MIRFLLSSAAFVGVLLIGLALGIRPTLGEILLVIVACALSDAITEALK